MISTLACCPVRLWKQANIAWDISKQARQKKSQDTGPIKQIDSNNGKYVRLDQSMGGGKIIMVIVVVGKDQVQKITPSKSRLFCTVKRR